MQELSIIQFSMFKKKLAFSIYPAMT